jgi:hypothetical protein
MISRRIKPKMVLNNYPAFPVERFVRNARAGISSKIERPTRHKIPARWPGKRIGISS